MCVYRRTRTYTCHFAIILWRPPPTPHLSCLFPPMFGFAVLLLLCSAVFSIVCFFFLCSFSVCFSLCLLAFALWIQGGFPFAFFVCGRHCCQSSDSQVRRVCDSQVRSARPCFSACGAHERRFSPITGPSIETWKIMMAGASVRILCLLYVFARSRICRLMFPHI